MQTVAQRKNVALNPAAQNKSAHPEIVAQNVLDVRINANAQNHVQKRNAAHQNKNAQNAAQNQNHAAQAMEMEVAVTTTNLNNHSR